MAIALSRILSPTPLLYSFIVISQFADGAYIGAQFPFPEGIRLIYLVGMLWAFGWWLRTDSRRRGVLSVYDLGLFLYLAWPIVMPYYLVKTRRAKGLLMILGFVTAYFGATLLGILLSDAAMAMRL